jgi:CIC family chloride channel protein
MPKSPNFRFFQGGLLKHRTTPKFLTTQTEYFSLLFLSALVGGITGSVVALFEESIRWITEQRLTFVHTLPYAEYIAPVAAVLAGAAMAAVGFWLTFKFAPEVAGSGIPHIEGALDGTHEIRWHRVLPIKFIAGTLTIGSGMVLGREGPSIQIGGAVGRMIASKGKRFSHTTHILTAAHCVYDVASYRIGNMKVAIEANDGQGMLAAQRVSVKNIYYPNNYNDLTLLNDVAVLELSQPLSTYTSSHAAILGDLTVEGQRYNNVHS